MISTAAPHKPRTPPDTQTCWGYGDISSYGKDIREIMRRDKGLWGTGEGCGGTGGYRSLWGGGGVGTKRCYRGDERILVGYRAIARM